jgi:trigger factor
MQIAVEVLSNLERKITVTAPTDRVDQAVEKRLEEMISTFTLPGFRTGKVPMYLLRKRFAGSVRYKVIGQVIDATYREALTQEKLFPAGMPEIQVTKDKEGEPLEYEATLEIYPEIKLNEMGGIEIENITVDINQKDVDEMIQKLRRQKATWSEVDRPSQKGDKVIVSFEGRQNGELFAGGSGENVPFELGSGTAIPGFEEGFTGHKAGESVTLTLTFPTDYHAVALAGKPVEFKGTIHKVEAPQLPALDDEFGKQLGVKEGGIEQLRQSVLENMQREVKQKVQGHIKGQVLEKVLETNPIDVPKVLMQEELKNLLQQEQNYMSQMTGVKQGLPEPREELRELAKRRVHLGLLFGELVKQYNITAAPERVDQLIAEIADSYGDPEAISQIYRSNKNLYRQLEEKAVEDQLIEKIVTQVKQREKTMSYSEFQAYKVTQ